MEKSLLTHNMGFRIACGLIDGESVKALRHALPFFPLSLSKYIGVVYLHLTSKKVAKMIQGLKLNFQNISKHTNNNSNTTTTTTSNNNNNNNSNNNSNSNSNSSNSSNNNNNNNNNSVTSVLFLMFFFQFRNCAHAEFLRYTAELSVSSKKSDRAECQQLYVDWNKARCRIWMETIAKLSHYQQLPYKLLQLAHHDPYQRVLAAQCCLLLWKQGGVGCKHRQSRRFFGSCVAGW